MNVRCKTFFEKKVLHSKKLLKNGFALIYRQKKEKIRFSASLLFLLSVK